MTITPSATPVAFVQVIDRARALTFSAGADIRMTALPHCAPGARPVVGCNVPDIVAAVTALSEKGVAMTLYEGMGQNALGIWATPDSNAKVAFCPDCEGNVLSFAQA